MHGVPQGVLISILITTVMPEEATTTRTVENYQDACRNGIEKKWKRLCVLVVFVVKDHLHYKGTW